MSEALLMCAHSRHIQVADLASMLKVGVDAKKENVTNAERLFT